MKTTNIFFKKQNLFAFLFFICLGTTLKSQITIPYPVYNSSCFDVDIVYEIVDPSCQLCDIGTATIPQGNVLMLGGSCGTIQDVHIAITAINGLALSPFIVVGDPDPCMNTQAPTQVNITAEAQACGSNCSGPNYITYTITDTTIN